MSDGEQSRLEARVLILAPTGKDAALVHSALGRAAIESTICADIAGVDRELAEGAGALLLAEEAIADGTGTSLARALAAQPPWSDLPLLVLARSGADSEAVSLAMQVMGNVTVLERPMRLAAL